MWRKIVKQLICFRELLVTKYGVVDKNAPSKQLPFCRSGMPGIVTVTSAPLRTVCAFPWKDIRGTGTPVGRACIYPQVFSFAIPEAYSSCMAFFFSAYRHPSTEMPWHVVWCCCCLLWLIVVPYICFVCFNPSHLVLVFRNPVWDSEICEKALLTGWAPFCREDYYVVTWVFASNF